MKKWIKSFIEYALALILLFGLGLFVNKGIIIKGLYMDDLFNWAWFPGLNIFDYAFKFYGASRYRPFFDAMQFIEYSIVGNNPILFVYVNILLNSLVALFIYHFADKLSKNRFIAFLVASMYMISHFAYYQIGQVLGLLETEAQFFALLILYFSFKMAGVIRKNDYDDTFSIQKVIILFVLYFIIAFTHERFLCLAPVILFSILVSKTEKKKWPCYIIFVLELGLIFFIRHLAIGKMIPAGTGGTYVEDTFSIATCLMYCLQQVAFIFGFNIGPEHLVGCEFINIERRLIKFMGLASIVFLLVIVIVYFVKKMHIEKDTGKKANFNADILFALFVAMCIGASSVTIRVEMRFVYVSFTASLLYLSYMIGYIFSLGEKSGKVFRSGVLSILVLILFIGFFVSRGVLELQYRTYHKKIHFALDQDRVNSLYDATIDKYGRDDILSGKRQVYIVNQNYGFTDFYAKWFFTIYDKKYENHPIVLVNDISELPETVTPDNAIVLVENIDTMRSYIEYPLA